MRQRDLSDLWEGYKRFSNEVKRHYGIREKCHVRLAEDRAGRCVVYVVRRSSPKHGFDYGNFAADVATLRWMIRQQDDGKVATSYLALVEDFGGAVTSWDTAKNVWAKISVAEPYTGDDGHEYHWINDEMNLVGDGRGGTGGVVREPPF